MAATADALVSPDSMDSNLLSMAVNFSFTPTNCCSAADIRSPRLVNVSSMDGSIVLSIFSISAIILESISQTENSEP